MAIHLPPGTYTALWVSMSLYFCISLTGTTDRTDAQRTFRIKDANSILTHITFISAGIASPTTTPEEIIEIAWKVSLSLTSSNHLGSDCYQIQKQASREKDTDPKNMKRDILDLIPPEYLPNLGNSGLLQKVPRTHTELKTLRCTKLGTGLKIQTPPRC